MILFGARASSRRAALLVTSLGLWACALAAHAVETIKILTDARIGDWSRIKRYGQLTERYYFDFISNMLKLRHRSEFTPGVPGDLVLIQLIDLIRAKLLSC